MKSNNLRKPQKLPIWQVTLPLGIVVVAVFAIKAVTASCEDKGRCLFELNFDQGFPSILIDIDKQSLVVPQKAVGCVEGSSRHS